MILTTIERMSQVTCRGWRNVSIYLKRNNINMHKHVLSVKWCSLKTERMQALPFCSSQHEVFKSTVHCEREREFLTKNSQVNYQHHYSFSTLLHKQRLIWMSWNVNCHRPAKTQGEIRNWPILFSPAPHELLKVSSCGGERTMHYMFTKPNLFYVIGITCW